MLEQISAAILVGGLGTRLRSVVSDRPKVMAEVHGKPFLSFLLDQIASVGIKQVVLCTGYMADQVQATFGESYSDLRLDYSEETAPLGTAGALRLALPLLASDTVMMMNGDSFFHTDLRAFWEWHQGKKAKASILLTEVPDMSRFGQVQIDADGQVTAFEEKGASQDAGWINAGIYLIARDWITDIPPNKAISLEKEIFPGWIGQGLYGCRGTGRFLDIGTPQSYAMVEAFLANLEKT